MTLASAELIPTTARPPARLENLLKKAEELRRHSQAENTRRAYESDWKHFQNWCANHELDSLPATVQTISAYLSDSAGNAKPSTISRRCAAIKWFHEDAGTMSPTLHTNVKQLLAAINRANPKPKTRKRALRTEEIKAMTDATPEGLIGARDRALLLLGFATACRRSELVALNVEDLDFQPEALFITIRRSKTDQTAQGIRKCVPRLSGAHCPVKALENWLTLAGIESGPVFRSFYSRGGMRPTAMTSHEVARIVKRYAGAIGMNSDSFAGHSLRAGFATAVLREGARREKAMAQTGHKSQDVFNSYVRDTDALEDNAVYKLGL